MIMLTELIESVILKNGSPMTEDEVLQYFAGTYSEARVAHVIEEMLLEGHLYYDVDRKLNLVEKL